jgi:hypothetical protein
MAGTSEINYQGKRIFCLSVAGLQLTQKSLVAELLDTAKKEIRKHPPKSMLIITDVTNTGYDTEVATMFKEYAAHNTPYVKASAVVGVTGMQKIILRAIIALTGRDFHLAATLDEAKDWLAKK